jgi:uncharacterized protein (DUF427 family)
MSFKKVKPGPGQESVWDYPRPPRLETFGGHIRVKVFGEIIYDHNQAFRILETSHPPTYYLPIKYFKPGTLIESNKKSYCEFKGMAAYYHIKSNGEVANNAAWGYPGARGSFENISDCISIYAHQMDECWVNDQKVMAQEGDFYGGWITPNIVGPFKGGPGTFGW